MCNYLQIVLLFLGSSYLIKLFQVFSFTKVIKFVKEPKLFTIFIQKSTNHMKMYIKKERHDKRRALRHKAIRLPFRSEKSNEFGLFSRFCKTIKNAFATY